MDFAVPAGHRIKLIECEKREIEIWLDEQVVYARSRIRPREWDAQTSGMLRYKRIT